MAKSKADSMLKRFYPVILAIALFTGFGNMPIYKRYYISAIPGMGWSGNFYMNLNVHYISGALLLGLTGYFILVYLKTRRSAGGLTVTGFLRVFLIGLSLVTGLLLAMRNLSSINFNFESQMALAFAHIGSAMFLLLLSIGCGIMRNPWRRSADDPKRLNDYAIS